MASDIVSKMLTNDLKSGQLTPRVDVLSGLENRSFTHFVSVFCFVFVCFVSFCLFCIMFPLVTKRLLDIIDVIILNKISFQHQSNFILQILKTCGKIKYMCFNIYN
jgi:hypothetical protein